MGEWHPQRPQRREEGRSPHTKVLEGGITREGGGSHYNPHCSLKAREEEEEDEAVRATLRDSEARERALPSFPVGLRKGRRGGEPEGRGRGGEDEGRTRGGREERPGRMRGTSKNVL